MIDAKPNTTIPQAMIDIWDTPCPVCGALPVLSSTEIDDRQYEVRCTCCGVEPRGGLYRDLDKACAAWVEKVKLFNEFCSIVEYNPRNLLCGDGQGFAAAIFDALPQIMKK